MVGYGLRPNPPYDDYDDATPRRYSRHTFRPDSRIDIMEEKKHPASGEASGNAGMQIGYEDLRTWLAEAERLGEVKTVRGATWQEDIGMATELVSHSDTAPAVLFEDIPGVPAGFRVLANIFGGKRKNMTLGFPSDLDRVALSDAFSEAWDADRTIPPTFVETGPIFDNIVTGKDVDLEIFPTPMWHEADGGRYIGTGSYNVTQDPDTGWFNLGTYRVMLHDRQHVTSNAAPGKHGLIHHQKYIERGEKMPVVLVLGGDPLTFVLGGTEVPDGISEFDVAGGLRGKPLELVRGKVTGLPFPANAEIVLEGYVDPTVVVPEGPFGDWTGTYTEAGRKRPICEIAAVYYRNDPILLGFVPQSLPDEYSRYRAITRSALLKQNIQAAGVPDVQAVWAHECGGSRLLYGVSIKQRYDGHAVQAGHIACQCHVGAYGGRWVIVTDEDIDVSNLDELIWAALTRADPVQDIDFIRGAWNSPADPRVEPAERAKGKVTSSRMIINACRPYSWRNEFPRAVKPSPALAQKARQKFQWLLD
jgi:4-hydroxy-3-polyprenylbenzoate decarboxylase